MRTLLVDDDPAFRHLASMALQEAGVDHTSVATPEEALELLGHCPDCSFDLVLLDHKLPGMSGQELLRLLRRRGHDLPVVLVTVHDDTSVKIQALQDGADDYIVKPLEFPELVARLRAVIRRSRGSRPIYLGALVINPLLRRAECNGQVIALTRREFDLLYVLAQAEGRTVSRRELLRRVWGMSFEPGTNFIQVHMSKLRSKLRTLEGLSIRTIRGEGYQLVSRSVAMGAPGRTTRRVAAD